MHTVKGFGVVNKAEVDVFLELSYFFYDPMDVGNLICGSSALSKSSLNWWDYKWLHLLCKAVWIFHSQLKIELSCNPEYISGKNENSNLKRHRHSNIHSSTIFKCQDMEITKVPINR